MKVSNVPFKGTAEQETELRKRIAEHKGEKGSLMPIMQAAQEIYGYLPYQVQKIISDPNGEDLRRGYILRTVLHVSKGTVRSICLSWNRMLR